MIETFNKIKKINKNYPNLFIIKILLLYEKL